MREIHTIDPGRYEEGSRKGLVRQVGMIGAQELFDKLKAHLEQVDMMPDEYFLPGSHYWNGKNPELPEYSQAVCHTNWGGNEGIYIDIDLQYLDDEHKLKSFHLATGKTLGSSGDDFLHMSRIAAECSMLLNGWGSIVKVNEQEIEQDKNTEFTKNELTDMLDNMVNSTELSDRLAVAKQGYGLDKLVYDREFSVRRVCAEHGAGQDVLVRDPEPVVREALAHAGYCLDVLIKDSVAEVRVEVAYQGYGLDTLVNDPHLLVRSAVASNARPQDLAILVNDPEWFVREAVAKQGYGLDKLAEDRDCDVRNEVKAFLTKHNLTLEKWIKENPDRCVMVENRKGGLDAIIARFEKQKEEQADTRILETSIGERGVR